MKDRKRFQEIRQEIAGYATERQALLSLGFDITGGEKGQKNNDRISRQLKLLEHRIEHLNRQLVKG